MHPVPLLSAWLGTHGVLPIPLANAGIAVDSVNNIIVADCNNDRVQVSARGGGVSHESKTPRAG